MGSLFDVYLKQRDLRNFLRNQSDNIGRQLAAVDDQVQRLLDEGICLRGELARSQYLHHYVIGALDAITSFYERETRKRFGLELFRGAFVTYLRDRFMLPRQEAELLFGTASRDLLGQTKSGGVQDGYADGLLCLGGKKKPARLIAAFGREPMRADNGLPDLALVAVAGSA